MRGHHIPVYFVLLDPQSWGVIVQPVKAHSAGGYLLSSSVLMVVTLWYYNDEFPFAVGWWGSQSCCSAFKVWTPTVLLRTNASYIFNDVETDSQGDLEIWPWSLSLSLGNLTSDFTLCDSFCSWTDCLSWWAYLLLFLLTQLGSADDFHNILGPSWAKWNRDHDEQHCPMSTVGATLKIYVHSLNFHLACNLCHLPQSLTMHLASLRNIRYLIITSMFVPALISQTCLRFAAQHLVLLGHSVLRQVWSIDYG